MTTSQTLLPLTYLAQSAGTWCSRKSQPIQNRSYFSPLKMVGRNCASFSKQMNSGEVLEKRGALCLAISQKDEERRYFLLYIVVM